MAGPRAGPAARQASELLGRGRPGDGVAIGPTLATARDRDRWDDHDGAGGAWLVLEQRGGPRTALSRARPGRPDPGGVDAIIGLGILVGIEMGLAPFPLLTLPAAAQASFRQGAMVTIDADGNLMSPTNRLGE